MELLFRRPIGPLRVLQSPPVLASWNRKDHPDQRRLRAFLEDVELLLDGQVAIEEDHLVIELVVGLPDEVSLTEGGRDLDNYLLPIAQRLGSGRLDAAFARKQHAGCSTIAVAPAVRLEEPPAVPDLQVRTTGSSESLAWRQQIHNACATTVSAPLPPGPVSLCIRFGVSSTRNWSNLWKPAIDALGPVLGTQDPRWPFSPDDDRIVSLALHRTVDDALLHDVELSLWWSSNDIRSS